MDEMKTESRALCCLQFVLRPSSFILPEGRVIVKHAPPMGMRLAAVRVPPWA